MGSEVRAAGKRPLKAWLPFAGLKGREPLVKGVAPICWGHCCAGDMAAGKRPSKAGLPFAGVGAAGKRPSKALLSFAGVRTAKSRAWPPLAGVGAIRWDQVCRETARQGLASICWGLGPRCSRVLLLLLFKV